jgi:YD repeat-containing protein
VVSQRYLDDRGAAVEADYVSLNAGQSAWSFTVTYHDLNGMAVRADTAMGNRTTNTYDNFGRLLTSADPDAGAKSYTYRDDGTLATETDARGTVLAYDSDVLGRVTAVRNGVAGPILESYSFDRAGEAGLLDSGSTFVDGAEYKIDTAGYDLRGRPTGYDYVIPSVAGLTAGTTLPGTYRFDSFGYDSRDQPTTLSYPAQGTFATETATTGFLATGQPNNLISNFATYVHNSTYTNEGRLATRMLSLNTWGIKRSYTWDRALGRLTGMKAEQNGYEITRNRYESVSVGIDAGSGGDPTAQLTLTGEGAPEISATFSGSASVVIAASNSIEVGCGAIG